jgi:ribosomal protein L11 methyltransferase
LVKHWWEIQVICDLALEDMVFWRLDGMGSQGTSSQRKATHRLVVAYLPQGAFELLDLAAIALRLKQDALCVALPPPKINWHLIDEEDWSKSWKDHWHPEPIGDHFLINPAWITPPASDRTVLMLDPGAAFGTGAHATTLPTPGTVLRRCCCSCQCSQCLTCASIACSRPLIRSRSQAILVSTSA